MELLQSKFLRSVSDELNNRSLKHFREGNVRKSEAAQLQRREINTLEDSIYLRPHITLRQLGVPTVTVVPRDGNMLVTLRLPKRGKEDHTEEAQLIGKLINREFRSDTVTPNGQWISPNKHFTDIRLLFDLE